MIVPSVRFLGPTGIHVPGTSVTLWRFQAAEAQEWIEGCWAIDVDEAALRVRLCRVGASGVVTKFTVYGVPFLVEEAESAGEVSGTPMPSLALPADSAAPQKRGPRKAKP